jgi:hypothetical protein
MRGGTLGRQRRFAIAHACDFGSLRNEYYDRRKFDAKEYRWLRCELRRMAPRAATFRYIQQLRQAERNRPSVFPQNSTVTPDLANAVVAYRTAVLDVSLRWFQSISSVSIESVKFHAFLNVASLCQIADDLLDWKDDLAGRRPSYVTGFLVDRPPTAVVTPLRAQADALLKRTFGVAREDAGALPFAVAAAVTWMLVVALLKVRLPQ